MSNHNHDHSGSTNPTDWKHDGVRVVPGNQLDGNVPSTPGMDRKAAINFARVGAEMSKNFNNRKKIENKSLLLRKIA